MARPGRRCPGRTAAAAGRANQCPWALAFRDLRWTGFFQILTFFAILFVGYVYVWRKGVLDWGPAVRRPRTQAQPRKVA